MIARIFSGLAAKQGAAGILGLLPLLKGRRRLLALTMLSGVLAQGGTLASLACGAWLVGRAVTGAALPDPLPGFGVSGFWLFGILVVAAAGARWWQAHISHALAFALIETLQIGIYDGLERAAPDSVLGRQTGELAAIATSDAELMEHFYAHTLADYVGALLVPLAALAGLCAIHSVMAAALFPFLVLVASVPYWLARRAGEQGALALTELGRLNARTVEIVQGLRELAIFGRGRDFLARLARQTELLSAAQRRYGSRAGLELAVIDGLTTLAVLTAALVGSVLVAGAGLDRALFPLALVLTGGALTPIAEVTQTARKLGELRAGAARVLTIFHQPARIADQGRQTVPQDVTVRFEHVGFGYGNGRGDVLDGFDLSLSPGEMVALVGRSGAGKSTAANLLLRFWDVGSGRISIGGCDIRTLPVDALRQLVAYVPQDVHLFNETVADNLRLGAPDAAMDEVERAVRLAQAADVVAGLPQGYRTMCGERGMRLSGGQRQRLAIARALLTRAPILLLDEASSNLDPENEQALHKAFATIKRDHAVLVIAHRPSTIRQADRIIVLEAGRIVEQGRHDELLTLGGLYADLMASARHSPVAIPDGENRTAPPPGLP